MTLESCTQAYEDALKRHKTANGKAAETVLDLCLVLYTAKHTLGRTDWSYFQRKHGFHSTNEKAYKRLAVMMKIGKANRVLRPHVRVLPASITSLSHIARLPRERVDALTADGTIHSMMTVMDSSLLTVSTRQVTPRGPGRPVAKEKPLGERDYSVTLTWFNADFTPTKARSVIKTLQSFLDKHAESLGLIPNVGLSNDVDMAFIEADRPAA